jgi:hypothetical protein
MRQFMRFMAVVGSAVVVSMLVASSTVAAKDGSKNAFFVGQKTCAQHPTPPLFTCVMSASNVPLLQGATVKYVSVPAIFPNPMRIDSDVVLTTVATANGRQSTAKGHCEFYFSTGTGLCTYQSGTRALAGFRAAWVVGPTTTAHLFSVIGKYSISGNEN